jgi:hypothetical protein
VDLLQVQATNLYGHEEWIRLIEPKDEPEIQHISLVLKLFEYLRTLLVLLACFKATNKIHNLGYRPK